MNELERTEASGPVHQFGPWPTTDGDGEFQIDVVFTPWDPDGRDLIRITPRQGTWLDLVRLNGGGIEIRAWGRYPGTD